jgi:hypothetical protein
MVVELGLFALSLALMIATAQAFLGLAGAHFGNRRWMSAVRPAVAGQWVFVAGAFAVLAWAFYKNDFSVAYVAQNSNSELPLLYRFSAVWGAHEGSLLLWAFALSTWSLAVAAFSRNLPETFAARVMGVPETEIEVEDGHATARGGNRPHLASLRSARWATRAARPEWHRLAACGLSGYSRRKLTEAEVSTARGTPF